MKSSSYYVLFFTTLVIFVGVSTYLLLVINRYVPWPYMDEVFHIPQAQKYCSGNFKHWDPKITTPPGLYILSIGVIVPIVSFFGLNACSVVGLRLSNVIFAALNFVIIHALIGKIHASKKGQENVNRILMSLNIALLPTLYFFTFLYYTDAASTAVTLLAYLLHKHGSHKMAACVGCLSVFIRQTNIVWVAFFGGLCLWERLSRMVVADKPAHETEILHVFRNVTRLLRHKPKKFWKIIRHSLSYCYAYLLVGIAFSVFVVLNEGVALGDRKAHEAGLHLAQCMYFLAFVSCFTSAHISLKSIHHRCKDILKSGKARIVLAAVAVFICVHWGTYGHRYILADNRHFTFYLWRKVINRTWYSRYLLAPAYLASYVVLSDLIRHKGTFWKVAFGACAVGVLVPQRLIELRYFTVPYIILRLEVPPSSTVRLLLELSLMGIVNFVTVYVFLEWPFTWPKEHTLQRFMW